MTTNLAFSEWPKVFGGDEKYAASTVAICTLPSIGSTSSPVEADVETGHGWVGQQRVVETAERAM